MLCDDLGGKRDVQERGDICTCVCYSLSHVRLFATPEELTRLLCPWNSLGKNTRVCCYSLLQGIFPTQVSNPGLRHCRQILYHLSHQGSLDICIHLADSCCFPAETNIVKQLSSNKKMQK